jgi:hypothetical protein
VDNNMNYNGHDIIHVCIVNWTKEADFCHERADTNVLQSLSLLYALLILK